MLNVAVSRAVKSLTVVTSQAPQNDRTNYGDLARYIEYNNCAVIQRVLQKAEFSFVDCAVHVSLVNLIKDYSLLTKEEAVYARNPLTHVDFLLFRRMDKSPLLAVEVDGTAFHAAGSVQAGRDEKKKRIKDRAHLPRSQQMPAAVRSAA